MKPTPTVVPYDLVNPPLLKPHEQAVLSKVGGELAGAIGTLASEYLCARIQVALLGITRNGGTGPEEDAETPSLWVFPEGMQESGAPVWRLACDLAGPLVDMMVCGRTWAEAPEEFSATRLERRLVAHLCKELYIAWQAVWPTSVVAPDAWRCIKDSPELAGPSPSEWVKLTFSVSDSGLSGTLDVYIPVHMARLPAPERRQEAFVPTGVEAMQFGATTIDARVRLAKVETTLQELFDLQVGDVLPLETPKQAPLSLAIAGREKLTVLPGVRNGRISVQIADPEQAAPLDEFVPM